MFLRDIAIPDGMEIGMFVVEEDVDSVSASIFGFGVKGLVDVSDEMEEEFQSVIVVGVG